MSGLTRSFVWRELLQIVIFCLQQINRMWIMKKPSTSTEVLRFGFWLHPHVLPYVVAAWHERANEICESTKKTVKVKRVSPVFRNK
jgi:hypothetical protein